DPSVPVVDGNSIWALTFIGLPAAILAVFGLFSRRPGAGLARTLAIGFGLILVGTPATLIAYHVIPGFPYLSPVGRLLPFFVFGLVLLAALGADVLQGLVVRFASPRLATAATVFIAALIVIQAVQAGHYSLAVNPKWQPRTYADLFPETPLIDALTKER